MKFTVVLQPETVGYSVICPALPGCVSQGDTLEEALDNIKEAIYLCLEVLREEAMPFPKETADVVSREIEECLKERAEDGLPLTIETREVEVATEVAV